MLFFSNDYSEGAHPKVLEALAKVSVQHNPGYGSDPVCDSAKEKIKKACQCPDADIYFISGGTQTNQLVIDTVLAPYEGVISPATGHVNVHEAGAIEFTGHKVIAAPAVAGKLCAADVDKIVTTFYADDSHDHCVFPGMVYISQPTEYGTMYTLDELKELHQVCQRHNLPLFADGARLISALPVPGAPSLADMAKYTDVFYIGGTKSGLLLGEAVVFTHGNTPAHFVTRIKQHGALMAKGFVMGAMFDAMFTDDLYKEIGQNAIDRALELREILAKKGYKFFVDSPTNQTFIVMDDKKLAEFGKQVVYSFWEKYDDNSTVIRLATSWATTSEDIKELEKSL